MPVRLLKLNKTDNFLESFNYQYQLEKKTNIVTIENSDYLEDTM